MGGIIRGRSARLTPQREQFAWMVAEGHSFAAAYRAIYPPRQGERSKQAELVAAKRLAHHPAVEQRRRSYGSNFWQVIPMRCGVGR